ncbi:hypothetical protein ACP70R_030198 [Stipagrostis hirtigluma subsp. patula]
MEALRNMNLPVGFGFYPSDGELVSHYLKRKILGQNIDSDLIPEVDIYKHEPWDLPEKCNFPLKDNKWHFFASRDRKYPTGSRSNRATIAGYWKSTGKDRAIKVNKRTVGTKKTLVFHEGRPPSGRRTEWIMHEYYLDEKECRANPDMKDAFVLCRVTKRDDWALENDNEGGNRNPDPPQLNDAATSVVSAEVPENAAASVVSVEVPENAAASVNCAEEVNHDAPFGAGLSNDAATLASDTVIPDDEMQQWLKGLIDYSFSPVVDTGFMDPCLNEQHAESSNLQNTGSLAPKNEPDHGSPSQNGIDYTNYLLPEDLRSILCPGVDNFHDSMFPGPAEQAGSAVATDQAFSMMGFNLPNNFENGVWKEELQYPENNNPNLPNGNVDNGITVRRRNAAASAANGSPSAPRIRLQVGINRMVTSNSESINQTMKFADNSGHLGLVTAVEHQKKRANDASSLKKKSDVALRSQGYFRCSSAGFKVLFAVCMIGVAAVVYCMGTPFLESA